MIGTVCYTDYFKRRVKLMKKVCRCGLRITPFLAELEVDAEARLLRRGHGGLAGSAVLELLDAWVQWERQQTFWLAKVFEGPLTKGPGILVAEYAVGRWWPWTVLMSEVD
jgi:hypothetical protein